MVRSTRMSPISPTSSFHPDTRNVVLIGDNLIARSVASLGLLDKITAKMKHQYRPFGLESLAADDCKIADVLLRQVSVALKMRPYGIILCWHSDVSLVDESTMTMFEVQALRKEYMNTLFALVTIIKQSGVKFAFARPGILGENDTFARPRFSTKSPLMLDHYRAMNVAIATKCEVAYIDIRRLLLENIPTMRMFDSGYLTVDGEQWNARGADLCAGVFASVINRWYDELAYLTMINNYPFISASDPQRFQKYLQLDEVPAYFISARNGKLLTCSSIKEGSVVWNDPILVNGEISNSQKWSLEVQLASPSMEDIIASSTQTGERPASDHSHSHLNLRVSTGKFHLCSYYGAYLSISSTGDLYATQRLAGAAETFECLAGEDGVLVKGAASARYLSSNHIASKYSYPSDVFFVLSSVSIIPFFHYFMISLYIIQ